MPSPENGESSQHARYAIYRRNDVRIITGDSSHLNNFFSH